MNLYPHQQELVDLNPSKHGLFHATGTGKTNTSIELANRKGVDTLVVCPKMLKPKWEREIEKYGNKSFSWEVVTKETFKRDYKEMPPFNTLILDEAHFWSNYKSQLHKRTYAWIKVYKPENVYLLTATPLLAQAAMSVYSLGVLLGKDWKLQYFRNKYFVPRHMGSRMIMVERSGIEDELAEILHTIGNTVRIDDMHDDVFVNEYFEATPAQKKLQKEVDMAESVPIVRIGKRHQIASGILLGNEYYQTQRVKADKNERILDLIHEHPKLVIFGAYREHLNLLADLCAEHDIPHYVIHGDTKDRDGVVQLLEVAPRAVAIIASQCSAGYELPSFKAVAFASLAYDFIHYQQAIGRFSRINVETERRVFYHLLTKGSMDEAVLKSLKKKENFSEALYAMENNDA